MEFSFFRLFCRRPWSDFCFCCFSGRNGPLGKLLLHFGATVVFSWPATVIAATVVAFPLMYLTARAALEQVDPHFLQAARTLGASEWRVFREVALPLAWPGVLAGTILSFARALGEFGATLMLAGNIPGKTATIPIAIYFAVEADDIQRAWPGARWTWRFRWRCSADSITGRARKVCGATAGRGADVALEVQIEKKLRGFHAGCCVQRGEAPLSILGPSGAGKTMLLRCIAGLERPDRGRIALNERVLFDTERQDCNSRARTARRNAVSALRAFSASHGGGKHRVRPARFAARANRRRGLLR